MNLTQEPAPAGKSDTELFTALRDRFAATLDPMDQWGLTVVVPRDKARETIVELRDGHGFTMLVDLTVVDYITYPGHREARFAVVYLLKTMSTPVRRMRVKVWVEEEDAVMPSVHDLFKIADWQEREAWDQYGVRFEGHPNLKRLLNHWAFVGHPLRKDYPAQKRQQLDVNDPMVDQLEARLRHRGYELLEPIPKESAAVEETIPQMISGRPA